MTWGLGEKGGIRVDDDNRRKEGGSIRHRYLTVNVSQ